MSYSDGRDVDTTRLGTSSDNFIDHSNNTIRIRDLLFGMDGNDTIKGGDGDDFLYGGADPGHAGSGKDKLYGGAGGDMLFGGDDNDFLNSGLNVIDPYSPTEREDRLDGGDGDDVLIMRGMWCVAAGGAGDDQFWITDTGDGWSYEITDSDAGDFLYWHGYHLTGGAKQVIEMIFDPDPAQGQGGYADVGALDGNGFRYYYGAVNADVFIVAPDGSGITIRNFMDGDLGIHVGDPYSSSDVVFDSVEVQPDVWQYRYQTSLSLSAITLDAFASNYADLPGFAATLANDGPSAMPTTWLP